MTLYTAKYLTTGKFVGNASKKNLDTQKRLYLNTQQKVNIGDYIWDIRNVGLLIQLY